MADVFVSYARADKARVAPLVAALEAQGWSVWWDPEITPGQEFDRQIVAELSAASAVLVVWTANSVESRWVRGEARDGADRHMLVPVRFGNAVLPIDFRAFHTIDLDDADVLNQGPALQATARAVGALIVRTPRAAAPAPVASPPATTTQPGSGRVAICVLPFSIQSADPEQQAFADGITADIITELTRWRSLAVRPRTVSFRFRGNTVDIGQVARELQVRYVVEGSIRRLGDRIRISVDLVDTETGRHVWGERYDRAQSELFEVQDQVVQQIAGTLVGRVQVSDVERARRKPPSSLDAYELVLRGNALPWDEPEGNAEAIRLFQKAIEIDPGYALAHALLATMRCGQWNNDIGTSTAALDEAHVLAKRAVELDDGDSTCHSLLAHVCLMRRSFVQAVQHVRRSAKLNPNNAWNQADLGLILSYVGEPEEALACFRNAQEIDPYFDPPWYWRQSGQACMTLRRFEDALSMFAHIPVLTCRTAAYMAACHARLGDQAAAASCVKACLALQPDFSIRNRMLKEPFRNAAAAEYLAESMRLAGLPE